LDQHWLPLTRRVRDPLRWWRLFRWLKHARPETIRFWFAPGAWLRRLCRYASPHSRWQVLFRSAHELPTALDRSWSALDTAWYDNPLLLERDGSLLAHAGKALLEKKVSGTFFGAIASRADVRKNVLSKLNLSPETILLLTIGPLVREKNQDQLFWSLDQLSCTRDDVRLLVIGDGPDRARLEHHARLHHIDHRIVWLGRVDSPAEYLRAADLYVSADPRERFSRAMLEARAAGLPIIAHDTATNRQIVNSPAAGTLVDPTYLADFAGTIYRWLIEKTAIHP
jgi:glycosyltransferase involved in cell wall biosynthesis